MGDDDVYEHKPCWRYCLHIAYYGTGFVGWQRQVESSLGGLMSVQELMENVVTAVLNSTQRVNVTCVSRTDAGTHALYQYGTIKVYEPLSSLEHFQRQLNHQLPDTVRIWSVTVLSTPSEIATVSFRFRSKYKKYIYYIQQGYRPDLTLGQYSWFLGKRIDVKQLREALSFLVGEHDFRPFSQGMQKPVWADKSCVRTLLRATVRVRTNVVFSLDPAQSGGGEVIEDASSLYKDPVTTDRPTDENKRRKGDRPIAPVHFICIELIATGFLRHMVRRIIGSVRPIAEGTYPPTRMKQILDGEIEPGPSAPTKGLWLHRTWLTEEDWNKDTTKDE